jgi:hypothetical protein
VSRALILRQYGVHVSALAGATIGALLVAKVVLIADMLPAVNRFPEKPLIYNVVWKTLIYVVGALVVHYLEHLVPVWFVRAIGRDKALAMFFGFPAAKRAAPTSPGSTR